MLGEGARLHGKATECRARAGNGGHSAGGHLRNPINTPSDMRLSAGWHLRDERPVVRHHVAGVANDLRHPGARPRVSHATELTAMPTLATACYACTCSACSPPTMCMVRSFQPTIYVCRPHRPALAHHMAQRGMLAPVAHHLALVPRRAAPRRRRVKPGGGAARVGVRIPRRGGRRRAVSIAGRGAAAEPRGSGAGARRVRRQRRVDAPQLPLGLLEALGPGPARAPPTLPNAPGSDRQPGRANRRHAPRAGCQQA